MLYGTVTEFCTPQEVCLVFFWFGIISGEPDSVLLCLLVLGSLIYSLLDSNY